MLVLFPDILKFDNSYSWARSKELFYCIQKHAPDTEICPPQFYEIASHTKKCNESETRDVTESKAHGDKLSESNTISVHCDYGLTTFGEEPYTVVTLEPHGDRS